MYLDISRYILRKGLTKLLVLYLLLRDGDLHGYEIMKKIKKETKGAISPSPGNIYPALRELASRGFVSVRVDDMGRKIYSLTERGREIIMEKKGFIEEMLRNNPSEVIEVLEEIHALIVSVMSAWRNMDEASKKAFVEDLKRLRRSLGVGIGVGG
ncbi:MAG: hypothetical protein DJ555_07640 [Desulfurococcaceae archaeon]|nr:MAG: hypothetical protein DJ555_07640 [Desulfurococcaceae archaeon]